jgi:hypothetical protein
MRRILAVTTSVSVTALAIQLATAPHAARGDRTLQDMFMF